MCELEINLLKSAAKKFKEEKNYEEMEKCYISLINLGDGDSMNEMGNYHQNTTGDYEEMKKYYKMGVEINDAECICSLSNYYFSGWRASKHNYMEYLLKINANKGHKKSLQVLSYY